MTLAPVRPLQASDERAVEALLQDLWQHDPKMLMVYRVHRPPSGSASPIRHSLVAEVDGEVRGVGSLMEHTLHPRLLWAAINVAPDQQRRGLGSALYEALQGLGDGRPWMVKLTLRDEAGTGFLRKRGFFNPRRRGIMGILDPSDAGVRRWLDGIPRDVPGYRFLPLDDPHNPLTLEDVALVQAAIYRQYHAWNPPVEQSVHAALAHYCGPNVLPGSHLCVFEGDELIGAANLFRLPIGGERNVAYLAHVGVAGPKRRHVHELTAALIRRSLEWAGDAGMRVRFEADEWYAPHLALYETAPAQEIDRDFAIFVNDPAVPRVSVAS